MKEMVKQLGKYRTKKKMRLNTEKSKVIEFWKGGKKKEQEKEEIPLFHFQAFSRFIYFTVSG